MSANREIAIKRLTHESESEFARLHGGENSWCQCVAWWVPGWDGWGERTAAQNLGLRQSLFASGIHDGYLIYADEVLAGWCQVWKRDAFAKLAAQFEIPSDDDAWMIGCVLVLPAHRQQGIARSALDLILSDLRLRGARTVDAYPKRGACDDGELWNGAESTYLRLGFAVVRDDPVRPVLRLSL